MEEEGFKRKMGVIAKKLEYISQRTFNMAMTECADPSNPDFKDLMALQNKLIEDSDKLIQMMEDREEK